MLLRGSVLLRSSRPAQQLLRRRPLATSASAAVAAVSPRPAGDAEAQAVYHRGSHQLIDVTNAAIAGDVGVVRAKAEELVAAMAGAARDEGTNVLMTHVEAFDGSSSPPGFASVVLLDESHISAHAYSDEGLLAIDVFTCGADPAVTTGRITERISRKVAEMWPAAAVQVAAMQRFEQFDIAAYLGEYYGLERGALRADNRALLEFFHRAYEYIGGAAADGAGLKVLELGGGPTLYQLLSASRVADEICFTDLLATNVRYVAQHSESLAAPADRFWEPYSQAVAELESKAGCNGVSPLARLSSKMTDFGTLDVSQPGAQLRPCVPGSANHAGRPSEQFDVVSACFVFEASAKTGVGWGVHLQHSLEWLAPGGHLVTATLLDTSGVVTEGGRQLETPVLTAEMIEARLVELGLEDIRLSTIDSHTAEGPAQIACITARKPARAAAATSTHSSSATMSTSTSAAPDGKDNRAVAAFVRRNFKHFNAAALVDAADGYRSHIESGGAMVLSMAGAMSTAEIGISLAEMIRQGKVHGISLTGANLEEDRKCGSSPLWLSVSLKNAAQCSTWWRIIAIREYPTGAGSPSRRSRPCTMQGWQDTYTFSI